MKGCMKCPSGTEQLEQYIMKNPLPEMETLSIDDVMLESDKNHLDYVVLHHLPTDAPDRYAAVKIFGDGNCFPCVCSYPAYKDQERYDEFRVHLIYKQVQKKHMYLHDEYVSKGANILYRRGSTVDQIAIFPENYNLLERLDLEHLYKLEVLEICTSGAYKGVVANNCCSKHTTTSHSLCLPRCQVHCETRFEQKSFLL